MRTASQSLFVAGLLVLVSGVTEAQDPDPRVKAEVEALAAKINRATSLKSLKTSSDALIKIYENAESFEVEEWIRKVTVPAFADAKRRPLKSLASASKSGAWKLLLKLKPELEKRREAALKVIYDESVYLREDTPGWSKDAVTKNGQREVNQAVDQVREVWKIRTGFRPSRRLKDAVAFVRTVNDTYLERLDARPDTDDLEAYEVFTLNCELPVVTLQTFVETRQDLDRYTWNRMVERCNATVRHPDIGKGDREHVRIVNDYREMLGRRRCLIEPRLCKASKKHSAVCSQAGTIWHVGIDGSPQSRAEKEGFTYGVGENVAAGLSSPKSFWWEGWYMASDHHRNALLERYNAMGYGQKSTTATQMFSAVPEADAKKLMGVKE